MTSLLVSKIKSIFSEPRRYFSKLSREKGVKTAFAYLLVLSVFSSIMGSLAGLLVLDVSQAIMHRIFGSAVPATTSSAFLTNLLIGFALSIVFSFAFAGLLHVWIMIFGGKEGYAKTYQLYVYSKTPGLLLGWIPFIGIFAVVYNVALLIIGTQQVHGISKKTSLLMYLIPIGVMLVLYVLFFIFMIFMMRAAGPELFSGMSY